MTLSKHALIQAENDEADLAEMRDGVISGLSFRDDLEKDFADNLKVCTIDDKTGIGFAQCLRSLLEGNSYDLVLIDPLFAYCGGNVSDQAVVSSFLRGQMNPILHRFNVGCIFVHHVNKPPTGKDRPDYGPTDFAYSGSGSSELANWMRAGVLLRSIGKQDVFELKLTKRASRAGWKDVSGQTIYTKLIRHSRRPGVISWDELTDEEARTITTAPEKDSRVPSLESFLTIFPTEYGNDLTRALLSSGQIQNEFRTRGWLKDAYKGLCDTAVANERLGLVDKLPRNRKLYGLPHFVKAYKTSRLEKNTILEQPALPKRTTAVP